MKRLILTALLCVPAVRAAASPEMTAPIAPSTVHDLRDAFVEAVDNDRKRQVLKEISQTPPTSLLDVEALYDLFMRFPDEMSRSAALDSLQLLSPDAEAAEPLVIRYLEEKEPASVMFGIKAALRLRSRSALPIVKQIAEQKFKTKAANDAFVGSERDTWWTQYEALAALAQWQGEEALPLLKKKANEAPNVAKLMGTFMWPQSLDQIAAWSLSKKENDQNKAASALDAAVPLSVLRATRERMLAYVRDPKAAPELRHQLALKAGACSTPEEVGQLLKEHAAASNAETKRLLAAALFASRDPQVAPLLLTFAKEDPAIAVRAGARVQLRDMLPPAEYRALVEWAAKNDPDAGNRELARRELSGLK
jgi:hypothetical protein